MYINNDALQPDKLEEILALRPEGADIAPQKVDDLEKRMKGALIGRFAGCVLGIPVELYSVARMQAVALETGTTFPPPDILERHRPARKDPLPDKQENRIYRRKHR